MLTDEDRAWTVQSEFAGACDSEGDWSMTYLHQMVHVALLEARDGPEWN